MTKIIQQTSSWLFVERKRSRFAESPGRKGESRTLHGQSKLMTEPSLLIMKVGHQVSEALFYLPESCFATCLTK